MTQLPAMRFTDVANVISVIAGLMTILGIGGLISWSFFRKERGTSADNTISVFAFAIKTGLCLLLLWPFAALFTALHVIVVLSLGPDSIGPDDPFLWDPKHAFAFSVSYILNLLIVAPLYFLVFACIYIGSIRPFRVFWSAFR